MNLANKLVLLILLIHLPAYQFLFKHHHCTFSPSWSVNISSLRVIQNNETKESDSSSIVEPMNLTRGNITLVALLDARLRLANEQAKKFSVMLNFLKSNGLNKISFIIINSANSTAYFDQLRQNVNNSDVHMFQDTSGKGQKPIWQLLNGKNYDVFVYNRCGKIVYHISYPLSILDPNEPVVQATLLATYYEDLCSGCQLNHAEEGRTNETSSLSIEDRTITSNYTNRTGREETNEESIENYNNQTIFTTTINNRTEFNKDYISKGEILKNSNSTLNVSDIFVDKDQKMNRNSSYLFYSPWQLFKYFLNKSDSTFNLSEQQHSNITLSESTQLLTGNSLSKDTSTRSSEVSINGTMTNEMTNVMTNTSSNVGSDNDSTFLSSTDNESFSTSTENTTAKQTVTYSTKINLSTTSNLTPSIVNSSDNATNERDTSIKTANKCAGLDINCSEFSIDKMLAVRLCCLNSNSILSTGSGCRKFDRSKCDKVSPIIKCCLRNLSEILDDYFSKNGAKNA